MATLRIGQFWLLLAAVILASLYPLPAGSLQGGVDKILHFSTYFFLFLSLDFAYARRRRLVPKFFLLLLCSWLVEVAQHFLPARQYSLGDLLANLFGLFLGLLTIGGIVLFGAGKFRRDQDR